MIQKKGKGNRVDNLCTINLIETNFNFNNKVIAKDLLVCAEKNGLLLREQYSSRYRHYAAGQAINKKLLYDIALIL